MTNNHIPPPMRHEHNGPPVGLWWLVIGVYLIATLSSVVLLIYLHFYS